MIHHSIHISQPKQNQESEAVQQKRKFLAFPSLRIQEFNKQLQKPHTRSSTYSAV